MRVLFVSDYPHLPDVKGGLQTTTHDLCLAIKLMGAEAAVLCGVYEHDSIAPNPAKAGQTSEDESLGYLCIRAVSPAAALPLAAAKWDASVIVVQSGTGLAPMVLASLNTQRATAVYFHNVEVHQLGGSLVPDPSLLFLANSAFTALRWQALFGITSHVIEPVVCADSYVADGGDASGTKILFVNPIPIKGVELVFALAQMCPDLPFLVVESWPLEPNWQAHCQHRARALGNVQWLSQQKDMRGVYAQAKVLLMPSVWEEAFGRTVIEAQLNGVPVLASNRGALPDTVANGGMALDPHADVAVWAQALRSLLDNHESFSAAARQRALAHTRATPLIVANLLQILMQHAGRLAPAPEPTPAKVRPSVAMLAQAHHDELLAQHVLAEAPDEAAAWWAMSDLRAHQRRWTEAKWAIDQALVLEPETSNYWRHAAWVLTESGQHMQALQALQRARNYQPDQLDILLETAQAHQRSGVSDQALALIDQVSVQRPQSTFAQELRVHCLAEGGLQQPSQHALATAELAKLIRTQPLQQRALKQVLRLVGLGHDGAMAIAKRAASEQLDEALRDACTQAVHLHSYDCAQRMAALVRLIRPHDGWLTCAALMHASMGANSTLPDLTQRAREWARSLQAKVIQNQFAPRTFVQGLTQRPRLAYLCSQPHYNLLERVLAAHGQAAIEVYVFTDETLSDLPPNVHVHPLQFESLAETCAANAIEVVIDTGGLHPFGSKDPSAGQYGVFLALAARLAPVQVAWLGTWGSSGGLFDALLTDRVSVPVEHEEHYDEAVIALEGGLWCWSPPLYAPAVSELPALHQPRLTIGVIARPVRMSDEFLIVLAKVASLSGAHVCLISSIADDFDSCRRVLAALAAQGVGADRVLFEPTRSRAAFLEWFADIDIVLDTFPGSGGLSLLDALWMGVPVVTLAGGWAGARQGASILANIGRPEWVADDAGAYMLAALALASDVEALARDRSELRACIAASPLLDGARVARQIEAFCQSVQPHAQAVMAVEAKDRLQLLAAKQLGGIAADC
jgi:predicted O-linked N-acetylglucosamine transferase (SPINDLY family)